jgi:hypothetical protein
MNNVLITISLVSCAAVVTASDAVEWRPCNDFLTAVRQVESSNGRLKVGDKGQSLGDFQLSEAAWLDVNEWRRARSLKTYRYEDAVFNSFINKAYAANYLTILYGELSRKLRRGPTHAELYAAYNMGLGTFGECKYRLSRVNPTTRARARQITEFLAAKSES